MTDAYDPKTTPGYRIPVSLAQKIMDMAGERHMSINAMALIVIQAGVDLVARHGLPPAKEEPQ